MILRGVDRHIGLTGNHVLAGLAAPVLDTNRRRHAIRSEKARLAESAVPHATRTYHEVDYAADS